MNELAWRFPKLDDGQEQGINDSGVATFKGSELYDNLAREICQNSLDAKADDKETATDTPARKQGIYEPSSLQGFIDTPTPSIL